MSLFAAHFKVVCMLFCIVRMLMCAGACVCMCACMYALRIVSTEKIFINTYNILSTNHHIIIIT